MAIYNVHVCVHILQLQCAYPMYMYNAIVHEVITPGRSVQLWYSLVGILIID